MNKAPNELEHNKEALKQKCNELLEQAQQFLIRYKHFVDEVLRQADNVVGRFHGEEQEVEMNFRNLVRVLVEILRVIEPSNLIFKYEDHKYLLDGFSQYSRSISSTYEWVEGELRFFKRKLEDPMIIDGYDMSTAMLINTDNEEGLREIRALLSSIEDQSEACGFIMKALVEQIEAEPVPVGVKNAIQVQAVTSSTSEATKATLESVEVDPRLAKFAEMYSRWSPESKSRIDWKRIQVAMLAKKGALLKKVEAIPKGPIMFGADKNGNILFANGGVEPILTGKTFPEARKAAKAIGLDLFPCIYPYGKSEEELMYEAFTGEPLVRSEDKLTYKSSFLESGEKDANVSHAHVSHFGPTYQRSGVHLDRDGNLGYNFRGIRGLLRAKA